MCGIAGQIKVNGQIDRTIFNRMRDSLAHRGPDDADSRFFYNDSMALGHRRLSFLDLTAAGRQPMSNEDDTVWIVLNGEIYNYIELREILIRKGHQFKTKSDTEVIIHGYEQWGIEVVNKLKGMFAFGLADIGKNKIFLVRDRFGIKPLYYRHNEDGLTFASELKAILEDKTVKREIDFSSFADYFVYRYIPSPKTIWKGISKVPPAFYLEYDIAANKLSQKEYWTIPFGNKNESGDELAEAFGKNLEQSICIHARSDVPVGSFLSGGYDSSSIVYYLAKAGYKPDTFSIGFDSWSNSEHQYAALVADAFQVPLSTTIAGQASLDLLAIMPEVYDEPIADISIIPTWLVSHLAAKKVKAVMSGEGADELLGGYAWQKNFYAKHDIPLLEKVKKYFSSDSTSAVPYYADAMAMGRFDKEELTQLLMPRYQQYIAADTDWFYRQNFDPSLSPLQSIQKMDIKCFMGELVLTKIDRASMANSLEVRVPFLDHELFETVLRVNEKKYFKPEVTKFLLYENIKKHLSEKILNRVKQGFVGPDSYYMDMALYRRILDESKLIANGIIRKEYYLQLLAGKDHWKLWKLTVMEKWYQHWCV
jgi:asparagine synthase (glutamine-hydrolysing)